MSPNFALVRHIELGEGWAMWRLCAVRSAGLPVSWIEPFALTESQWTQPDAERLAREASRQAGQELARQPSFVEAVVWQNPAIVRNWLGAYAADTADLSRRDQREALLALLAQRYCAKNETIGFFGPVAWAHFDGPAGLSCQGRGGLRRRSLFVEAWAGEALATAIATDERMADFLVARRHPATDAGGAVLYRPRRPPRSLSEAEAALWQALDKPREVRELVERGHGSALESMRAAGEVLVGVPLPLDDRPEAHLRAFVEGMSDTELRAEYLDRLDLLRADIERVAAAAGDPVALLDGLDRAGKTFSGITGRSSGLNKPDKATGRAIVYEDCRADFDITIGEELLDALRRPLAIVLDTARWFTAEVGAEMLHDLRARHATLRRDKGDVALSDLVLASGDILNGTPGTAVDRVAVDFTERWRELLATAHGSPPTLRSADIGPLVPVLFPFRDVGWRAARQHSPDLLLSQHQWVLGELHLALNTLENRPFLSQADRPEELIAAMAHDFADGRVVPVYPKSSAAVTSRTYPPPVLDPAGCYTYWSYTADDGHPTADQVWPGAGLRVHDDGDALVVRPLNGDWTADVREFLGEFLTAAVVNRFRIRPKTAHLPRLLLDDVVLERESWRVPVSQLPLPTTPGYLHRALRDYLVGLGAPRFVFARSPLQPKPILVDRDAPLSLRNLARLLRREGDHDPSACVDFVEMVPAPDELWLKDAAGNRFTSEFRVVAVDTRQRRGEHPLRRTHDSP